MSTLSSARPVIPIRKATHSDFEAIWPIFQAVIQDGETYPYEPAMSKEAAQAAWFHANHQVFVAETEGRVTGTYYLRPNQPGLGAHVSNAGFMVHPDARGHGIGAALGRHALEEATRQGYQAMQFNYVVSTNTAGVTLWQRLGFEIIGTIPKGFQHRTLGLVDAYIMFRHLP